MSQLSESLSSRLSLGTMSCKNHRDAQSIIRRAYDGGINLFDTADLYNYGQNEEWVGKAVKDFRRDVMLSTKVGNEWRSDGSGWDWNPKKEYILRAVESSLRRLQTDYIDLYLMHGGTIEDPLEESIAAFQQLKQEGKILAYGLSSIRPNVIKEWLEHSEVSTIMMQYSILDRRPEEWFDLLQSCGIKIMARGSMAKGLLAGKPAQPYLNYSEVEVRSLQEKQKEWPTPLESALGFVLGNPNVLTATVGVSSIAQLNEILAIYSQLQLEYPGIDHVLPANTYDSHR